MAQRRLLGPITMKFDLYLISWRYKHLIFLPHEEEKTFTDEFYISLLSDEDIEDFE